MIVPLIDLMEAEASIWRPYIADRITISRDGVPFASFFRPWWCAYHAGPSLFAMADTCGQLFGSGSYGLASRRLIGFQTLPKPDPNRPAFLDDPDYVELDDNTAHDPR